MKTASGFYSELSAAYQFPLYFRPNPVSLRELLAHVPTHGAKRPRILVITQAQKLLSAETADGARKAIVEALIDAASDWGVSTPPSAHRGGLAARPFVIVLTGSDNTDRVLQDWQEAGTQIARLGALPTIDSEMGPSLRQTYEPNAIRTGFNAMSTLSGFVELAGARWRSQLETAHMLHLSDANGLGEFEINLGIWIPSIADGGIPASWSDAHLLANARDFDPGNTFKIKETLDNNVSMPKADRLQGISSIFDSLILPTLSMCTTIADMQVGGKGRCVVRNFRVTRAASQLLHT